eukprot:14016602-Alexandrium_andersonii.AAC.1
MSPASVASAGRWWAAAHRAAGQAAVRASKQAALRAAKDAGRSATARPEEGRRPPAPARQAAL